jgi:hypothetical protein
MERRLKEENITKAIISWLEKNDWSIICFDFPQSGTGKILHSNFRTDSKNKDSIIPDIIAIKSGVVVFFENKDRFFFPDFQKLENIRKENSYSKSLDQLLKPNNYSVVYFGVGVPVTPKNLEELKKNKGMVDFIINSDGRTTTTYYQKQEIFK